jgi:hypothetical protein
LPGGVCAAVVDEDDLVGLDERFAQRANQFGDIVLLVVNRNDNGDMGTYRHDKSPIISDSDGCSGGCAGAVVGQFELIAAETGAVSLWPAGTTSAGLLPAKKWDVDQEVNAAGEDARAT